MGTRTRAASRGLCLLCKGVFAKSGMTAHLRACRPKRGEARSTGRRRARPAVHLLVQGSPVHWLHLEIDQSATLAHLDAFLRITWLECCGHLSEFEIEGGCYGASGDWYEERDISTMDVPLGAVLREGTRFAHTYDFGSTTRCTLRVVALDDAPIGKADIRVLARNDPPVFPCSACGVPATKVCGQCAWDGAGWCCKACAGKHACGEEMLLPVVDSPRVGTCAYGG